MMANYCWLLLILTAVIRSVIVIVEWLCILLPHPGACPQCGLRCPCPVNTLHCDHLASADKYVYCVVDMCTLIDLWHILGQANECHEKVFMKCQSLG